MTTTPKHRKKVTGTSRSREHVRVPIAGSEEWGIIGHEKLIRVLEQHVSHGPNAHAFIFIGPRGVGKHELVHAFARGLLCTKPRDGHACGDCASCVLTNRPDHPDLTVIKAADSDRIGIDEVREGIRRLDHRPSFAPQRVAIVELADTMTEEAANALLKTLEEPSGKSVILLTASHRSALPKTVISRCSVFFLNPVPAAILQAALVSQGLSAGEATKITNLTDGRSAYATFLSQHPEGITRTGEIEETFLRLIGAPLHERIREAEEHADEIGEAPENFFERWESVARKLVLASFGKNLRGQAAERIMAVAQRQTPQASINVLASILEARRNLAISNNARLTLESLFLRLP